MKNIKIIAIYAVVIFFICKVWKLDLYDRTHPYGLDNIKNKKYTPSISGEKYGVNIFKGRPTKKDDVMSRLYKLDWLTDSYKRTVTWRRSLCFGMIGTLLLVTLRNYEEILNLNTVLLSILVISSMVYFYQIYNNYHIEYYNSYYVHQHINALRKQLKQ